MATTMRITPELRKQINAAVRTHTVGAAPRAEVGYREDATGTVTANCLLWPEVADLWDMTPLAEVKTLDVDPANPGCVELDLYVYSVRGGYRELETNVGILIRDGQVVGADANYTTLAKLKATLGFPVCHW